MKSTPLLGAVFAFLLLVPLAHALDPVVPKYKGTQLLVASAEQQGPDYLAFPALLETRPDEVLIAYKRGWSHGADKEATVEMLRFDPTRNVITQRGVVAQEPGIIEQMGEWVRFPNGNIGVYFDVQAKGDDGRAYRAGMRENRSTDGGRTFQGVRRSAMVDGVEYGYPFDFVVEGRTTYMLVMAFGYRPGGRWSVDVIRSDDNGGSWHFVRNLSQEFGGHPINESAFMRYKDGFLVTTRGYDSHERLYRTDATFHKLAEADLTEANSFIESQIGRPRLFARDGGVYLIGRNTRTTPEGNPMELALFRLDPEALAITRWVILDNAERAKVTDGYYAVPYFHTIGDRTMLEVITYKALNGKHPDILRLEYDWGEVR